MENTNENKAAFMAQYWGQHIFRLDEFIKHLYYVGYDVFNMWLSGSGKRFKESWIDLRPLSSITDDEAIEVAKIFGIEDAYIVKKHTSGIILGNSKECDIYVWFADFEVIKEAEGESILDHGPAFLEYYDYLRSKGFALPWRGLSVEQQIAYGWIKLIS